MSKWTLDALNLIKKKVIKKKIIIVSSSMGSWIALNLFKKLKIKIKGFIGIGSAPEFLDKLMWNKFSKKIKKTINQKKIYYLESETKIKNKKYSKYVYPLTKQLFIDGKKNKVLNKKIYSKIPVTMFHGEKDEVVPKIFSRKVLNIFPDARKKIIIIKNGDHSLSKKNNLNKICNELSRFIKNCS